LPFGKECRNLEGIFHEMIYQKFQPATVLKPFVECYYIWQSGHEPVKDLVVESPPNGFCSIVFNSGDVYFLHNKKYEKLEVPKEFVAGQAIYSYKLFLNGNISIAGIVFRPSGLATLFNLPVYQYTEERIDLKKVFMPFIVEKYAAEIAGVTDATAKAKLLENFVLQFYEANKPEPDYIDEAANKIVDSYGLLNVNELMENIYMSRRNFERRFFKKVGLSPKYYARIRRIGYSLNLVAGKKKVDWAKVFSECEYYDQSHFIKDFLEFTGRTPQQYLEENSELGNLVEKPKERPLD
jgi:AraC-like DNA-binding protein